MSGFPRLLTVGEVIGYVRELLQLDPVLADVWVRGEVAELSRSPAGHLYFTLKDEEGLLRCVLFKGAAFRQRLLPRVGDAVLCHGGFSFYEARGLLQLVVDLVQPEGVGIYQLQFEALKLKLEQEGLFDSERKRPLPPFPRRIGVITSDGGAVIHDILAVLGRRYPLAEVVFAPCPVQGDGAAEQLVAALRRFDALTDQGKGVDLVIVARGGGSPEELAPFNDERLARAAFACRVPVVSAIGHETDYTILDLVADLRAPTPSAAAELVAPDVAALRREVQALAERAAGLIGAELAERRAALQAVRDRLLVHSPQQPLARRRQAVASLVQRAAAALQHGLQLRRAQVAGRALQLQALSPLATLERGYSVATTAGGALLTDATAVRPGERVTVRLRRGEVVGGVIETRPDGTARPRPSAARRAAEPPGSDRPPERRPDPEPERAAGPGPAPGSQPG